MESYTLIFIRDQHARPVQIAVPKVRVKQAVIAAAAVVLFGAVLVWDYQRLRADNAELADLRVEAFEQREEIAAFRGRLVEVDQQIAKVAELERKVRIIANLPGTAGVGGEGVREGGRPSAHRAQDDAPLAHHRRARPRGAGGAVGERGPLSGG